MRTPGRLDVQPKGQGANPAPGYRDKEILDRRWGKETAGHRKGFEQGKKGLSTEMKSQWARL